MPEEFHTPAEAAHTLARVRAIVAESLMKDHALAEVSPHFTCREIEAVAEVLRLLGIEEKEVRAVIEYHASEDEEGDEHWRPTDEQGTPLIEGQCLTCAAMPGQDHDATRCLPDPEPLPEADTAAFLLTLDRLTDASHADDAERYRAHLEVARRQGASDDQIEDAWLHGWTGHRPTPLPSFDAWGKPRR
ncbi:hypothetical protein [Mobilicoccus caccae]|nr:hypothetical protein [Mobilicoccus caccae]